MKKKFLLLFSLLNILVLFGQYEDALIPYRLKDKWGFCNIQGKIKIQPIFQKVDLFSKEGYAIVKQNGKYGIINAKGIFTCLPKYKTIVNSGRYYGNNNSGEYDAIDFNNKSFVINNKGQKQADEDLLKVRGETKMYDEVDGGDRVHYYFKNNEIRYKESGMLSYNYKTHFYFKMKNDTFIYCINNQNKHGILNTIFKEIVPFKFYKIKEYKGLFRVSPDYYNNNEGLYKTNGEQVLSPDYRIVSEYLSKILIRANNKEGVFDLEKLKITIPVMFKKIIYLNNGNTFSYLVSDSSVYYDKFLNYTLLNENNQPITDTIFNEIIIRENQDTIFFIAKTAAGWNRYNLKGEKMLKEYYNFIDYFLFRYYQGNNVLVSKYNHLNVIKYGIITMSDSVLIPMIYDELKECNTIWNHPYYHSTVFYNNKFLATNNQKSGLININNQILVPLIYKNIEILEYTPFALVTHSNGKTGYLNYDTGVKYFKD